MKPSTSAEVIVIGLGAVGSAALYQSARRGVEAIGIDRFSPPHALGSSHGETRMTRQGVGEGDAYVPLAIRSHEIWRELEAETGEDLLLACGALIVGPAVGGAFLHGKADFVARSIAAARRFGVPHEALASDDVTRRFPQLGLRGDERAYFEPGGGLVYPERCIAAQLREAERLGATVVRDQQGRRIDEVGDGVTVSTAATAYQAATVIVAAGAWAPGLVGAQLGPLALQPQQLHWFAPLDPPAYAPERFPAFIWSYGPGPDDSFYGFPIAPGAATAAVKMATETTEEVSSPEDPRRGADSATAAATMFSRHVQGRLEGLSPRAVRSAACLYTTAPDADFVIGPLCESRRVLIASACSGHGFKHSAAVGELLYEAVRLGDKAPIDAAFDPNRLAGFRPHASFHSVEP